MMRLIAVTCTLFAAGCVTPPIDGGDGSAPTTGIYRLTETRSGDCQTLQPDDSLDAELVAQGSSAIALFMSSPWFGDPSTILGRSYVVFTVDNGSFAHDDLMCSGVIDHRALTVESSAPDHLRVRRVDSFSNVAAGTGDCTPGIVPIADCAQTTELDYTLVEPCAKSCIQSDFDPTTGAPILRCSC